MAYSNWVSLSPTSGSGSKNVQVSVPEHTGREARTTNLTFVGANVSNVVRTVKQLGKSEFVEFESNTVSAPKGGDSLTIRGTSNAKKLTFSIGSSEFEVEPPEFYIVADEDVLNGMEIAGDPGKQVAYEFSVIVHIPENETVSVLTSQLIVKTPNNNNPAICTIKSEAGDPFLNVIPEGELVFEADGGTKTVTVESNISWSVS